MNGTTSATTTSGLRISMKPMNIATTPASRRSQVRMRFSLCAAANMSAADIVPGRTINSASPALVWYSAKPVPACRATMLVGPPGAILKLIRRSPTRGVDGFRRDRCARRRRGPAP